MAMVTPNSPRGVQQDPWRTSQLLQISHADLQRRTIQEVKTSLCDDMRRIVREELERFGKEQSLKNNLTTIREEMESFVKEELSKGSPPKCGEILPASGNAEHATSPQSPDLSSLRVTSAQLNTDRTDVKHTSGEYAPVASTQFFKEVPLTRYVSEDSACFASEEPEMLRLPTHAQQVDGASVGTPSNDKSLPAAKSRSLTFEDDVESPSGRSSQALADGRKLRRHSDDAESPSGRSSQALADSRKLRRASTACVLGMPNNFERMSSGEDAPPILGEVWRRRPRRSRKVKLQGATSDTEPSAPADPDLEVPVVAAPSTPLLQRAKTSRLSTMSKATRKKFSEHSSKLQFSFSHKPSHGTKTVLEVVEAPEFSYAVAVIILCNTVTIGWQTNYLAVTDSQRVPLYFDVIESVFCLCYTAELIMRLRAYGCGFFSGPDRGYNIFDFTLVVAQWIEEAFAFRGWSAMDGSGMVVSEYTNGTTGLRLLRIFRIFRLLRLLKFVHVVGELNAIVTSIANSGRALVWVLLLLFIYIYAWAVCLTQLVTDNRAKLTAQHAQNANTAELHERFGSLWLSMLALFQAITDGIEWVDLLQPLMKEISPMLSVPFCFYISVVAFALMNILTGIFVDRALQVGKDDKRRYLLEHAQALFASSQQNDITWTDFQAHLEDSHMKDLFEAIDVDQDDAHQLFHLLDADHTGCVEAEEFVNGCLRLDGPAKAVDLAVFAEEHRRLTQAWAEHAIFVKEAIHTLTDDVTILKSSQQAVPKPTWVGA